MLAKFVLLISFCCVSLVPFQYHDNIGLMEAMNNGKRHPQAPTHTAPENISGTSTSASKELDEPSQPVRQFATLAEFHSYMSDMKARNPAEWERFPQNAQKLLEFGSEFEAQLTTSIRNPSLRNRMTDRDPWANPDPWPSETLEFVLRETESLRRFMVYLKRLKLLDLLAIHPHLINSIMIHFARRSTENEVLKDFSEMNRLMQSIDKYGVVRPDTSRISHPVGMSWWRHSLNSIDFLFEEGFLSEGTIQKVLEDASFFPNFLEHLQHELKDGQADIFLPGSYRLTEHWYWQRLHGSFRAFSREAEDKINEFFLLRARYLPRIADWYDLIETVNGQPGQDLRSFIVSPSVLDIWQLFVAQSFDKLEGIKSRIIKMIRIVATDFGQLPIEEIIEYICDVLDLVAHKSPDFFPSIFRENPELEEGFDDRFQLTKFGAKMKSLNTRANQLYDHIRKEDPSGWSGFQENQSDFNAHLEEFKLIFDKYNKEFARLCEKSSSPARSTSFFFEIPQKIHHFEQLKERLQQKSKTFVLSK